MKSYKKFHSLTSTWETFLCENDFSDAFQYIIVMVHSHAIFTQKIFDLFPSGTLLINMPCCINNYFFLKHQHCAIPI